MHRNLGTRRKRVYHSVLTGMVIGAETLQLQPNQFVKMKGNLKLLKKLKTYCDTVMAVWGLFGGCSGAFQRRIGHTEIVESTIPTSTSAHIPQVGKGAKVTAYPACKGSRACAEGWEGLSNPV